MIKCMRRKKATQVAKTIEKVVMKKLWNSWTHVVRLGEAANPGTGKKKHRTTKQTDLLVGSANKNCFRTFADLLADTSAHIYLGQEIAAVAEECWKIKTRLLCGKYIYADCAPDQEPEPAPKWHAEGTASVIDPNGGRSAGNLICVRPNIDIAPPSCPAYYPVSTRNKYEIVAGHLSAVIINAWFYSRLLVLNSYLDQQDQLSTKNRAILMMAGVTIECLGIPFVIGADWNFTPKQIAETEWIDTINGKIVVPETPTCRPTP